MSPPCHLEMDVVLHTWIRNPVMQHNIPEEQIPQLHHCKSLNTTVISSDIFFIS
jgi:hypothetical protein